jgi:hypothetical protein
MPAALKDFRGIHADYRFFERHTDESAVNAAKYLQIIRRLELPGKSIDWLDFGAGEGNFLSALLRPLETDPARLKLSLVEPDPHYRLAASEKLAAYSARPIDTASSLAGLAPARHDVITSHHVFYYVEALADEVARLLDRLDDGSVMLASMADVNHPLIRCWEHCFGLIGEEVPYHLAAEFETILERLGAGFEIHCVDFQLAFPDTNDNRLSILRFHFGEYLNRIPVEAAVQFFDPYCDRGHIVIACRDRVYEVHAARGR